jgi:transcriptional regulator with XRE-family HTH domain
MNIGKRIRLLRHQRGWSQQDAAQQLGLSIPAFSKIENNITDLNLSRIEQIAKLFGLSVIELLIDDEDATYVQDQLISWKKALSARDAELISLQDKVIKLHEELRQIGQAV